MHACMSCCTVLSVADVLLAHVHKLAVGCGLACTLGWVEERGEGEGSVCAPSHPCRGPCCAVLRCCPQALGAAMEAAEGAGPGTARLDGDVLRALAEGWGEDLAPVAAVVGACGPGLRL